MIELTDSQIPEHELPLVVVFGSKNCGGCKWAKEKAEKLVTEDFAGRAEIGYADTFKNTKLTIEMGVRSLPQVIILNSNDEVVHRNIGWITFDEVRAALRAETTIPTPLPNL